MTRLVWNAIGERFFETGVEQGVLYVSGVDGVPWNGLISVSESPSGADITPYYIDGVKYLNVASSEEFAGTIQAFTYPDEFAQCDGTVKVKNGLSATQQPKKSFGLSYKTRVGNDVDGVDHAYKIHLVYNALASPSQRDNTTIADSVSAGNFSWSIVTKPPIFAGYKPTAHFVIDSRDTPASLIAQIEDILYGSPSSPPRLPDPAELISIFTVFPETVEDAGLLVDEYSNTLDGGAP